MIPSDKPTGPVAITTRLNFCFVLRDLKSGDGRTDVQATRVKIVIATCRDCGSAEWINIVKN